MAKKEFTAEYALIGKFVYNFELLAQYIRVQTVILLGVGANVKPDVSEIFLHQSFYTLLPLYETYRAMVCLVLKESPKLKNFEKRLKEFSSVIESVSKTRNMLLHGTYFMKENTVVIGTDSEQEREDPDYFNFVKKVIKSQKVTTQNVDKPKMLQYIKEAQIAHKEFVQIASEIIFLAIDDLEKQLKQQSKK
jgi:hypothetical protein